VNGSNALFHLFGGVVGGVEMVGASMFKLRTEGYAANVMSRERELRLIFTDIAYQRVESIKKISSPEAQLAFLMVTTLLATDQRNRAGGGASQAPQEVPQATQDKFADL